MTETVHKTEVLSGDGERWEIVVTPAHEIWIQYVPSDPAHTIQGAMRVTTDAAVGVGRALIEAAEYLEE
jgi:hypothetical protein